AIITNLYATDKTHERTDTWERFLSESLVQDMQVLFSNIGVKGEHSFTAEQTWGGSDTDSNTNSTAFSYTLTDGDPGDIMSIDVYSTSTGNVFITRGGQTMCPYEGELV